VKRRILGEFLVIRFSNFLIPFLFILCVVQDGR
jgi:hypothetical protein